ncbi:hypothetical protein JI739_07175 [Ramlibacter sp. AW1]|uniref:Lipoprotein n=1 Tax=Ramlibacter aurantiacus TaxID=2801330 RepID=A0A937D4A1_9BURK|nr:hypothetical protein [Ramlibacter aurantiacus]MBL0420127.1 hypothetical protein [Ramlibacter aurantiacus]
MRTSRLQLITSLALAGALLLPGCAVITVAGAAASVAATGASLAVGTTVGAVKLTGRAAGAAVGMVVPGGDD